MPQLSCGHKYLICTRAQQKQKRHKNVPIIFVSVCNELHCCMTIWWMECQCCNANVM